jgi:hypothetical protein
VAKTTKKSRPTAATAASRAGSAVRRPTTRSSGDVAIRSAGWRGQGLVVGAISGWSRVAGVAAAAAALCLLIRPFVPAASAGGRQIGATPGVASLAAWLPAIVLLAAAGVSAATGRLPRLGLAVIGAAGALAVGIGLRWVWLLDTGHRTVLDLPVGGQALAGNRYAVGPGLWLGIAAAGLLVLGLVAAVAGWARTVTEDDGSLDGWRPTFSALGLFVGAIAAIAFSMAPSDSALSVAPPSVIQQTGIGRIGGLILVIVVVACCVLAATFRPWLATVGILASVGVVLLALSIDNLVVITRSRDLATSVGTVAEVVSAVLVLLLAAGAALVPTGSPADRSEPAGRPATAKKAAPATAKKAGPATAKKAGSAQGRKPRGRAVGGQPSTRRTGRP